MRILFVDAEFPRFDRTSAGLRMFTLLKLFTQQGCDCHYCIVDLPAQRQSLSQEEVNGYREALEGLGITVHISGYDELVRTTAFDIVFFEYFYVAEHRIDAVRIWQPQTRVIVDSVDVHYLRLAAKAALTHAAEDTAEAAEVKARELRTYAKADLVITVTGEDTALLKNDLNDISTLLIPNIHEVPPAAAEKCESPTLIFIGAFTHEPNVDSMLFFMSDIWPLIRGAVPQVRLFIVGGNPPPAIQALANDGVEVTGYVPDTLPYLRESWVSIAPLRFGAGMKGKVGEAMAAGTAVVTTAFGAQGLAITPGKEMMVAANAQEFAAQVVALLRDPSLRDMVGQQGRQFIQNHFSPEVIENTVRELLMNVQKMPIKHAISFRTLRRSFKRINAIYDKHIAWRFRSGTP